MACKDKNKFSSAEQSSKASLRTRGAIDPSLNIINKNMFDSLNSEWSADAKDRFNTVGSLFKDVANKAIANSVLFAQIDSAKAPDTHPVSVASPATIEKMKKAAVEMGVNLTSLSNYAKTNPGVDVSGINGVADLTQGVIAIAEGHADVALTEEMVHIGSAIIEAHNPKLITNLIKKIGDFKIYKTTLDAYKNKKAYQLPDGRPDIRKIKKEAADKLMAEAIINNGQNNEQYPELSDLTTLGKVKQWWNNLLRHISGLYKHSTIDIFESTADMIAEGNIGTVDDISSQGVFFQAEPVVQNTAVNDMYDKVSGEDKRLTLIDADPEAGVERHYTYLNPTTQEVEKVDLSVTQKIKLDKRGPEMAERKGLDAIRDASKMKWGSAGHQYIENMIKQNLIDKDGYAREEFGTQVIDGGGLQPEVLVRLEMFAKNLIRSYPEKGTRFLVEPMVINKNGKKTLASAIDFMALVPSTTKSGKQDVKVEMLDWKFTTINGVEKSAGDIPWYKRSSWKSQMGEYSTILRGYGMRHDQLQKARMIPFMMTYEDIRRSNLNEGQYATKVEIGDLNNLQEVATHLLPVPIKNEPTGVDVIDKLLYELNAYYDRNYKHSTDLTADQKQEKQDKLNNLAIAIRRLHVAKDFAPLVEVGKNFVKAAETVFRDFEAVDYETADKETVRDLLQRLSSLKKDSQRFEGINKVFLETYKDKDLSEKEKEILKNLGEVSAEVEAMMPKIIELENDRAIFLNVSRGWETQENAENILAPSKEIKGLQKIFSEGSKRENKRARAIASLVLKRKSEVEMEFNEEVQKFESMYLPLKKSASAQGVTPFSLIGKIGKGGKLGENAEDVLQIYDKVKPELIKGLSDARKDKDKKFIRANIDMDKHNAYIQAQIERQEAEIRDGFHSSNEGENEMLADMKVNRMKNSLDINRKGFDGWNSYHFKTSMYESIDKDNPKNQTKEYKEMAKNKAALDAWNFVTEWSERAKKLDHLRPWENSFFPLIEADALAKFNQSGKSLGSDMKEFFTDAITGRIEENVAMSNIDEETGEARTSIPIFYTKMGRNKDAKMMSKDISKVLPMWMHSILDYEANRDLESDLNNLVEVEKNVGRLVTDERNKILKVAGKPSVTKNNANVAQLEATVRDAVYGQTQDRDEFGNIQVTNFAKFFNKGNDPDDVLATEIRVKKVLEGANVWVRNLGVGLKPALSIANTVGNVMLSYIYKSGVYRYRDYVKNTTKVLSNQLDEKDKAILNFISPFSESNVVMKRRKTALKDNDYREFINTFSMSDMIQRTNSFPEEILQMINGQSMIENVVIIDGKLVNVRELVLAEDRAKKASGISQEDRQALKKSYEDRVAARLKAEPTLKDMTKVTDTGVQFEGVSREELAKLRVKILDHSRNLNGQMDSDDKAAYRRSIIMNSFMMFKHWIPKLITGRFQGIKKNQQAGQWEYGRSRLMLKTALKLMGGNIKNVSDIINQTEEGLKIMDQMLEEKKRDYYEKNGEILTITKEEWYDLMDQEIKRQLREFTVVAGMLSLLLAAKAAEPPEDATAQERNRANYIVRVMNKVADEVLFFYSPLSVENMTSGNIIPALGLLSKMGKAVKAVGKTALGEEDAHAAKYILNMIPIGYQVSKTLVPLMDEELAKEMGNVIAKDTNRR